MTIPVLIADDQDLVRAGLRRILESEPDIEVVAEVADGEAAVDRAIAVAPEVVLMDVRMPLLDGIRATERIMAAGLPATKILVLTTFDVDKYVYEAMRAGASGFLLKDAPAEQLVESIRQVARGSDALLAPSITRRLVERFAAEQPPTRPEMAALNDLTPRELEVLRLMAQGLSNAEIARKLGVGEATVKTHVARVLMKLGARDRVQAVVLAHESGFMRAAGPSRP